MYEKKVKCVSQLNVDPAGWRGGAGGGGGMRNGLLNSWNSGRAPAQGREGSPAADRFKGGAQVRYYMFPLLAAAASQRCGLMRVPVSEG